ncbi:MAG: CopD family protein [Candidatus Promineifilaceae bacterium]|jgi:uncharacterized membrane protein
MSWILAVSYLIHLLATVVWIGGIALLTLLAWPALQRGTLASNQWWAIQRKFILWANVSMVLLLITGFYQMTVDSNYHGFLNFDSQWAVAILLKHIAYIAMIGITVYLQSVLYPAMSRAALLAEQKPKLGKTESDKIQKREILLLRLNLLFAIIVLFFTALATAI